MAQHHKRYPYVRSATTPVVPQKSPPFLKGGKGGLLPGPDPHMAGKLQSVSQSVTKHPLTKCSCNPLLTLIRPVTKSKHLLRLLTFILAIQIILASFLLLLNPHGMAIAGIWESIGGTSNAVIEVSPNYVNDQTIFAGNVGGVYKTSDGGVTWNIVLSGVQISSLAMSYNYAIDQTIYAGGARVYAYGRDHEIYRSTDGGVTWSTIYSRWAVDGTILSLAFSGQTIFAADFLGSGLVKSTNGGSSWNTIDSWPRYTIVAISPRYPSDQTVLSYEDGTKYLKKSTDGGASWNIVGGGDIYSIVLSPNYELDNTIFTGGYYGINKSIDGGNTWITVYSLPPNCCVINAVEISPNFINDQTLFASRNIGGVLKSTNGGASWADVGGTGSNIASLAISPGYPCDGTLFAAGSSSVWRYTDTEAMVTCLYSIYGTVTENGVDLGDVTMTLSGDASATTTTAPDGTYSFTGLYNGNYTITPRLGTYNFSPYSRFVVISGSSALGQNFSAILNEGPVVFSDDFNDNYIDQAKWTDVSGYSVTETNETMKIEQAVTDNGGILWSNWININPNNILTIKRKVLLHYANNYFIGHFKIYLDQASGFTFGVEYGNMDYSDSTLSPSHGFFITRNNASSHFWTNLGDVSLGTTPVWDQWFDGKIIYNPTTGLFEYFINGRKG